MSDSTPYHRVKTLPNIYIRYGNTLMGLTPSLFAGIFASLVMCLLLLSSRPCIAADARPLLESIEKNFRDVQTIQTDFTERKKLSMFSHDMILQGRIIMEKPDRLVWRVHSPLRYVMIITDGTLQQWDEDTNRIQRKNISGNPIFEVVKTQLTQWFSGQYSSLLNNYSARVEQQHPPVICFSPREGTLPGKAVESIRVRFRQDLKYLEEITIREHHGDTTTLNFSNVVLNAEVAPTTWEIQPDVQ